jgi:hypothetical protein
MSVLNVDYRFKILSVDQEQSTLLVEYDPLDDDCLPVTLNCLLQLATTEQYPDYDNQESIPLENHLKNTAAIYAPIQTWAKQKYLSIKSSEVSAQINANSFISTS